MKSQIPNSKSQTSTKSQIPNFWSLGHWNLFGNWKLEIGNSPEGFTLIELLVVVSITAILTTVVTVNFNQLRINQQLSNAGFEMVSEIRQVQGFTQAGYEVAGGHPASAYEITFTTGSTNYTVKYVQNQATSTLETIALPQNIVINQVYVAGIPEAGVDVQFYAPFGDIVADGNPDRVVGIELGHQVSGEDRTVTIDGISGRISAQ